MVDPLLLVLFVGCMDDWHYYRLLLMAPKVAALLVQEGVAGVDVVLHLLLQVSCLRMFLH